MRSMCWFAVCAVAMASLCGASAHAAVLCARKNGALAVRSSACKRKESVVDVASLGLLGPPGGVGPVGPTGARGLPGPTGTEGPTGPQGPTGTVLTSTGAPSAVPVNFYGYFMDTSTSGTMLSFGQAHLQTIGVAGQFDVCNDAVAAVNYVVYVNGVRTAGAVGAGACAGPFNVGAGGDFQVTIRRAQIFGVHSGDSLTNQNYDVYGLSQL